MRSSGSTRAGDASSALSRTTTKRQGELTPSRGNLLGADYSSLSVAIRVL